MKIIQEFKEFAIKGNMFDMAIGIIIGTAFNKTVSSLVNDIILPSFSLVIDNVNFQDLNFILQHKLTDIDGNITQKLITLNYGSFIQVLFDFFFIAVTAFLVIKGLNSLRRKADNESDTTVQTPKNIELLSEIRDLLKEQKKNS
ncbi:large-conductance mechanosensitive channel protein MscL [Cyclobacteriaceae bacterium]|nr:large-conductance mechanosensitive channel protein MscL [Cyclobacteriaceae bacterium]